MRCAGLTRRILAGAGAFLLLAACPVLAAAEVPGRKVGEIGVTAAPFSLAIAVDLFDANPGFLPQEYASTLDRPHDFKSLRGVPAMHETLRVDGRDTRRLGAVADGLSRLLVRVTVDQPGRIAFAVDPALGSIEPREVATEKSPDGSSHWALALYTPPKGYPDAGLAARDDRVRDGRNGKRELKLEIRRGNIEVAWIGASDVRRSSAREVKLYRPPVVLIHGTYDYAEACWDWPDDDKYRTKAIQEDGLDSPYNTPSFARRLEQEGFGVFLVNYKRSNGQYLDGNGIPLAILELQSGAILPRSIPAEVRSHFFHNAMVAWDGARREDADRRGEGIKAALAYYRSELRVAATQADVIGHSMGGVLARVYARGFPLPDPDDPEVARASLQRGKDWFRRPDNLARGDIFRLITVGSTHRGSDVPGILQHYVKNPRTGVVDSLQRGVWAIGNWKSDGKFARGAFTDQIPGSRALSALGPTAVPAHAIATVAKIRDLDRFQFGSADNEPTYRERMVSVWSVTPGGSYLESLFRAHSGRADNPDGVAFRRMEEAIAGINAVAAQQVSLMSQLTSPALSSAQREQIQARLAALDREQPARAKEAAILRERMFLRFVAATFRNDWSDYTVSLDSALGGLPDDGKRTTILPRGHAGARDGILHGYQPRHQAVQARLIELLKGGMENFAPEGFPAYSPPAYFAPEQGRFRPYDAGCAEYKPLCGAGAS